MRIRPTVGVFAGALSLLVLATPAAAQGAKVDLAGGYQFFRFTGDLGENLPGGWGVSIAAGKDWLKAVGDVSGHYEGDQQLHLIQGGLEFCATSARVLPFLRLLSGVALIGDSSSAFLFTPEFGLKVMASGGIGVQASVGRPVFFAGGEASGGFRFFVGMVFRK